MIIISNKNDNHIELIFLVLTWHSINIYYIYLWRHKLCLSGGHEGGASGTRELLSTGKWSDTTGWWYTYPFEQYQSRLG